MFRYFGVLPIMMLLTIVSCERDTVIIRIESIN